jgi:hypothetical protein
MKAIRLYMREDQLKKFKRISEKTLAPVSALIRKAVDRYLGKVKREARPKEAGHDG